MKQGIPRQLDLDCMNRYLRKSFVFRLSTTTTRWRPLVKHQTTMTARGRVDGAGQYSNSAQGKGRMNKEVTSWPRWTMPSISALSAWPISLNTMTAVPRKSNAMWLVKHGHVVFTGASRSQQLHIWRNRGAPPEAVECSRGCPMVRLTKLHPKS